MSFKLGMKAKLYVSATLYTDTAAALPASNTEMDNAKDVTINLETGEADITTRANNGWRATAATLKDGTVEFEAQWKEGDAGFTIVKNAWKNSTEIAAAAMTGGSTGDEGVAGNFTVTNFSMNQSIEEAITINVTLKPSSHTDWITLS